MRSRRLTVRRRACARGWGARKVASDKLEGEIREIVGQMEADMSPMIAQAKARYDLYSMRQKADLPEHMTRFGEVDVPTPMLIHAASSLRADIMMNPTEVTVVPLGRGTRGSVTDDDRIKADNLEKASAVLWSKLDEGRELDLETIWHQLVSPYGVEIVHCTQVEVPEQVVNIAQVDE